MGKAMKKLLYIFNVTLLMLNIVNNAEANQQNFYSPKDSFATFKQPMNQNQYIIFDEIGEMASQMMYIHVNIPLNLTALYDQAELFTTYLQTLQNSTTSIYKRIPFTKAARDTGDHGMKRLNRIMKKMKNIDHNLPHMETRQKREEKQQRKKRASGILDCIKDYHTDPKRCDRLRIIKNREELHKTIEKEIRDHFITPRPDFPDSYWETYSEVPHRPLPTTYRPFIPNNKEDQLLYLRRKGVQLHKVLWEIRKEQMEADTKFNGTLPDFYIHNRHKRFIQAFSLVTDIVGTFMGAFNAYEIKLLKTKFQEMSLGHNMLVRVTQQHDKDIHEMRESLKSIVDVIDLMAEYNPGLLQLQISEQLDIFEDRVTIITNAIQQLHHRRLAIDLLTPDQMEIMHDAVNKIAHDEGFHNQAEKVSDYYQIEVTYSRTNDDIVLMVHVPCIKT